MTELIAVHNFAGDQPGDLPFAKGDRLQGTELTGQWWTGIDSNERTGTFPSNYVKIVGAKADFKLLSKPSSKPSEMNTVTKQSKQLLSQDGQNEDVEPNDVEVGLGKKTTLTDDNEWKIDYHAEMTPSSTAWDTWEWSYLNIHSEKVGTFTLEQLRKMELDGRTTNAPLINHNTLIWAEEYKYASDSECHALWKVLQHFAPLKDGWVEHKDAKSGKSYYYHAELKETTWTRPSKPTALQNYYSSTTEHPCDLFLIKDTCATFCRNNPLFLLYSYRQGVRTTRRTPVQLFNLFYVAFTVVVTVTALVVSATTVDWVAGHCRTVGTFLLVVGIWAPINAALLLLSMLYFSYRENVERLVDPRMDELYVRCTNPIPGMFEVILGLALFPGIPIYAVYDEFLFGFVFVFVFPSYVFIL